MLVSRPLCPNELTRFAIELVLVQVTSTPPAPSIYDFTHERSIVTVSDVETE